VLAFNAQAELLTGIDSPSAIDMQVSDVLDVRDAQGQKVTLPIHELSEGSVGNVFLVSRSGSATPVAVTSAVLRNESGDVTGGVAVVRDVSREHEMETMKSEFLSNISHELRTPLTPIRGYAELLGEPEVPPHEVKRFGRGILESTERLERIVGLLVDFSAMETGRLAPRSTPVDLSGLIKGLAGEWGARSPRHEVVAEVDSPLPKVMGDERLLKRSFAEILDNAVKFSPQGGTIRLRAYPISGNGLLAPAAVEIVVSDEGIGISNEDLPKIFSDFRQLDGSATRTYGGLGLGLTFVHRIVEAHNGKIRVESEQSRGTRLTISLPIAAGEGAG
jgi:PAS domain S-box-containing protein